MNNKMSLSFGISLVAVGILNFWFETTNIILFGLSISALLFSLIEIVFSVIEIFSSKRIRGGWLEFIYILPFALLISSFCYSNSLMQIPFISGLVNGRITSLLTITSFGLLFISGYINYKREEKMNKEAQAELVKSTIDESSASGVEIMTIVNNYIANANSKNVILDKSILNLFNEIMNYYSDKGKLLNTKAALLETGKYKFTIKEFEEAYNKSVEKFNEEVKNKVKNKTNKIKED